MNFHPRNRLLYLVVIAIAFNRAMVARGTIKLKKKTARREPGGFKSDRSRTKPQAGQTMELITVFLWRVGGGCSHARGLATLPSRIQWSIRTHHR